MVFTLDQQCTAIRREIKLREVTYPRMVASARMKAEKSVYELGVMKAILKTLESLQHRHATQRYDIEKAELMSNIHFSGGDTEGWEVWLDTQVAEYDGLCIGTGKTRDEAILSAQEDLQMALEDLERA